MVVSLLSPQSISTVQCIVCKKGEGGVACCQISRYFFSFIPNRETRKKLRQQEQASKKISHQKNDKVHISILSIEKTKK
jgi:hypothetical protein